MENKITMGALAGSLARATGKSKKLCEDFLREFFKLAGECLEAGETLKVKGFGTFKVTDVEKRESVSVSTGERQEIPSYKKVVFTPAKELASAINAPFQDFESIEIEDDFSEALLMFHEEDENILSQKEKIANPKEEKGRKEKPFSEITDAGINESKSGIEDENKVEEGIIEAGSDEEAEDDDITLEAYEILEEERAEQAKIDSGTEEIIEQVQKEKREAADYREDDLKFGEPASQVEVIVKNHFWSGFIIGGLSVFVVCLVIFIIGCFNDWWPESAGKIKTMVSHETEVVIEEPVVKEEPAEKIDDENATPIYDTVSTTRYLTTIAREHYGDFNFWPYIYIENESILGHPDRIVPGTQVVVPDLKKYGVEVSNPDDVAQAKKLGQEIYAKYRK